ncbi:MAG: 3-isopropylmalate dehydratase [Defluviitaleaceae bacterium]|nr:3-isopropylmalate dehydratase [Defluviitaleaceae bacterium]
MGESIKKGFVHKFGDDINTDYIISSRHKRDTTDCDILKKYIFADIAEGFFERIQQGDILSAGHNFGCGSAMEVAAMVVKAAGFDVVIAKSFARSFYRNAMNNGILLIEGNTDFFQDGDFLEIELDENGLLTGITQGKILANLGKLSLINKALYEVGGLIEYVNKYERLPV